VETVRHIFWKEIKAQGRFWAVEGWLGADGSPKCSIYEGRRNVFGSMSYAGVPLNELQQVPQVVLKANTTAMKKAELEARKQNDAP
jgi:hypothetical protein